MSEHVIPMVTERPEERHVGDTRECRICGAVKTLDEFYTDRGRPRRECKPCARAKVASEYRSKPGRREAALRNARASRFRRVYNLELEDYDRMLGEQGGRCAMCDTDDPGWGYNVFCVDHDHKTGKVRGLTCFPCNLALTAIDDRERMMRAASYLARYG